jgi:hypothetical protein
VGGRFVLRPKRARRHYGVMRDACSAVRLARPNGANTKLRTCAAWCRSTYSGSRFFGKGYTFIAGGNGEGRGGLCSVVPALRPPAQAGNLRRCQHADRGRRSEPPKPQSFAPAKMLARKVQGCFHQRMIRGELEQLSVHAPVDGSENAHRTGKKFPPPESAPFKRRKRIPCTLKQPSLP